MIPVDNWWSQKSISLMLQISVLSYRWSCWNKWVKQFHSLGGSTNLGRVCAPWAILVVLFSDYGPFFKKFPVICAECWERWRALTGAVSSGVTRNSGPLHSGGGGCTLSSLPALLLHRWLSVCRRVENLSEEQKKQFLDFYKRLCCIGAPKHSDMSSPSPTSVASPAICFVSVNLHYLRVFTSVLLPLPSLSKRRRNYIL